MFHIGKTVFRFGGDKGTVFQILSIKADLREEPLQQSDKFVFIQFLDMELIMIARDVAVGQFVRRRDDKNAFWNQNPPNFGQHFRLFRKVLYGFEADDHIHRMIGQRNGRNRPAHIVKVVFLVFVACRVHRFLRNIHPGDVLGQLRQNGGAIALAARDIQHPLSFNEFARQEIAVIVFRTPISWIVRHEAFSRDFHTFSCSVYRLDGNACHGNSHDACRATRRM